MRSISSSKQALLRGTGAPINAPSIRKHWSRSDRHQRFAPLRKTASAQFAVGPLSSGRASGSHLTQLRPRPTGGVALTAPKMAEAGGYVARLCTSPRSPRLRKGPKASFNRPYGKKVTVACGPLCAPPMAWSLKQSLKILATPGPPHSRHRSQTTTAAWRSCAYALACW